MFKCNGCREKDLVECVLRTMAVVWLRGLICVVPKHGVGERPGRYCVSNLAIDQYTTLLHSRQSRYGKLCWMSVFLRHRTYVSCLQSFRICSYECKCSGDCDLLTKLHGHECRV